ncbi:MAG: prepilin-type N-terminal cleavage/methylation domain-containing protein [bacterium]|nr:prepilin-type N-terminal cleavage/methylation domain-containing protein [bacterium]
MERIVFNDKTDMNRQAGFTLVEVMFALMIFMVIMLGLAQGELTALRTQQGNIMREEATQLIESELSRLKSERFTMTDISDELDEISWTAPEEITVSSRKGILTFARSIKITDIDAEGTLLKRIDVAVGWEQGKGAQVAPTNKNRQTALSTIIAARN